MIALVLCCASFVLAGQHKTVDKVLKLDTIIRQDTIVVTDTLKITKIFQDTSILVGKIDTVCVKPAIEKKAVKK